MSDRAAVITYLGELIGWYRHLEIEERLATEPAETLYFADDRQNANTVLDLGFEYANAAARIIDRKNSLMAPGSARSLGVGSASSGASDTARSSGSELSNLAVRLSEFQASAATAKANVEQLKQMLVHSRRKQRDIIAHRLATVEAESALAQSQVDSLSAMIDFEREVDGAGPSDLQAQIDQLKASVRPDGQDLAQPRAPAAEAPADAHSGSGATGMVGQVQALIALTQKSQALADRIELTNHLLSVTEQLRTPLRNELRQIDRQLPALAANGASSNLATVKDAQSRVEQLGKRHQLTVAALVPLSKQKIILAEYLANLERWHSMSGQRFRAGFRSLMFRAAGLALLLLGVIGGAALWRRLTFRYVHDVQRRHQLLQLSRIIVIAVIGLVLLFDFANELGALATVMGFAAAGIALTLQNVILSLAGYFYISGRYGIRVGDRVQISGISGDVLEIGLFKMTLMELGSDDGHQPTGRVVVFPNSVVFQPNGNFSRQLPGSTFAWSELRFTLAPECDYRLAERRLFDVVNGVCTRYRDAILRECRGLERDFDVRIETPRPQSRLRLSDAGIEIALRYPVQFRNATQISDEISRRLVDALKREPALRLVTPGTPMIQPMNGADEEARQDLSNALQLEGAERLDNQPIDNRTAALAAAAAAGATVANAFAESSAAAQKREGVSAAFAKP